MIQQAVQQARLQTQDQPERITGISASQEDLLALVYNELHAMAGSFMRQERANHTLQPTALVNEAWLRLAEQTRVQWQGSGHFCALAATMMRRVLVNHAHRHATIKRGGGRGRVSLTQAGDIAQPSDVDVIALDEALERLAAMDESQAKIVELRYFGGLSVEQTATELGISVRTVHREWASAKAWLRIQLKEGRGDDS